ncbi:MAG TPA: hypothetical protein VIL09_09010 [Microvirga sp.]|jgi:hypothetical protein
MPKKNDNIVGQSEGPIVNGGHQTPEQAAIVAQAGSGLTDAERGDMNPPGEPGRTPPAIGGSSGGHSDQIASRGPDADRKVAGGHYDTEQTHGRGDSAQHRDRPDDGPGGRRSRP